MALVEISKAKRNLKNRIVPDIGAAAVAIAVEQPAWGQARTANALKKRGRELAPFGVRSIWVRHDLETMKQRLNALKAKKVQ